jgi:RNA polymerase sigma factor (TIGR02999 family)
MTADRERVTQLLRAWRDGEAGALERLAPVIYEEMHRLARGAFRGESAGHTLQPTALVHEAFLHLVDADVDWQNRAHFYAIAARQIRRVLVNHAVAKKRAKRGGAAVPVSLEQAEEVTTGQGAEITDIDDALVRLAKFDARKSQILELHYFGGLTYEEMAEAMQLSTTTLHSELRLAKAWLKGALG